MVILRLNLLGFPLEGNISMIKFKNKVCFNCHNNLCEIEFKNNKKAKDGLSDWCIDCIKYFPKDYKYFKQKDARLKCDYGISYVDYNNLADSQNYKCKICNKLPEQKFMAVDHCHTTGRIRGLLCMKCNTAIGLLEDNVTYLTKAIEYLNTP